jgi:hypothetical protein
VKGVRGRLTVEEKSRLKQRTRVCGCGGGEPGQGISAFEQADEPALCMRVGQVSDKFGQRHEVVVGLT